MILVCVLVAVMAHLGQFFDKLGSMFALTKRVVFRGEIKKFKNRTDDLLNAIQALSQLSYGPTLSSLDRLN